MTSVVRVPDSVYEEARQVAALRGTHAGSVMAEAWTQYMENNRGQFADDLEQAARLLRDGTTDQLAAFVSRDAEARGQAAAERARSKRS